MYAKYEKDLETAEMKMLMMSMGVTKLDNIKSERNRGSMHVKDPVATKLKKERIAWLRRIDAEDDTNVAKQALDLDIPHVSRRGRPKNSWVKQMDEARKKYGRPHHKKYKKSKREECNYVHEHQEMPTL